MPWMNAELLEALVDILVDLPRFVRIVITSRFELDIRSVPEYHSPL